MKLWLVPATTTVLLWTCVLQLTAVGDTWGPRVLKGWPSCLTPHEEASAARPHPLAVDKAALALPPKSESPAPRPLVARSLAFLCPVPPACCLLAPGRRFPAGHRQPACIVASGVEDPSKPPAYISSVLHENDLRSVTISRRFRVLRLASPA
jgi:hypothetical protein